MQHAQHAQRIMLTMCLSSGDVKAGIEANSPYIAAVRRDVEVHGDAIPALAARAREARAEAGSLAPVRACLASLEQTLCRLTDERAVLKHFDWPEAKARPTFISKISSFSDTELCNARLTP
jgi:hypothetical protein